MTRSLSIGMALAGLAGLLPVACNGTPPSEPALRTDTIDVRPVVLATAEDTGPQDGVFDVFWTDPNLGMVDNNGYGNYRTVLEYDLPELPSDAADVVVTLRLPLLIYDGTRSVQIHGYAGDGAEQLTDFAINGLLEEHLVSGHQNFVIDVKAFVDNLRASNETFVGFNVREEPANTPNFTIMKVRTDPPPLLRTVFTTREVSP